MSKIQICNRALTTYLGAGRINSLTEETPEAEQCNLHYDDCLRTMLEEHPWTFATSRQVLAELTNDRPDEWSYRYQRPSNCLRVHWVNDPAVANYKIEMSEDPDEAREMLQDNIYSNVPLAVCEFTTLLDDTSKFSQLFKNALSALLASTIALPITEDLKRFSNASNIHVDLMDKAIAHDEQQEPVRVHEPVAGYLKARGIS